MWERQLEAVLRSFEARRQGLPGKACEAAA